MCSLTKRRLKGQSAADLPVAWQLLRRRSPECTVRQVDVKRREIRPVENVEEFEAYLKIDPLGDRRGFVKIDIELGEILRTELIGLLVPLCAEGRLRELPARKGSVEKR